MAYLTEAQRNAIALFRAKFQTAKKADGNEEQWEEKKLTEEQIIKLRVTGQRLERMLLEPSKAH